MTIIDSLLDTDFYIFTMMQATFHQYPGTWTKFEFDWRNANQMDFYSEEISKEYESFIEYFCEEVKDEIDNLCSLRFKRDELEYLSRIPYFTKDFIAYLELFRLNRDYIKVKPDYKSIINITIEGPLLNVIMFEVPVLAIVSQVSSRICASFNSLSVKYGCSEIYRKTLELKMRYIKKNAYNDFTIADFGTRRRAFKFLQDSLISELSTEKFFAGTSNVFLAKKYNVKPIGTMAHLWIQIHQQTGTRLIDSQAAALQNWANEYRGELGIALSDTITFNAFLKDFDRYFALLFDGCRHDSGDPYLWGDKLIKHYEKLRINPKTKTAVFSDGLTIEKALNIHKYFRDRIKVSFGIGTNLTNDCGVTPPQIVIKNTECNGQPTAKISDSEGKGMCKDDAYFEYLKKIIRDKIIRREHV